MSNSISEKLQSFITEQRGTYKFKLTRDLDLETDLEIYGDDVQEFFESFSIEFGVDISKFDASKYFSPEGDPFIAKIVSWIFRLKLKKDIQRQLITLGDLEKAIEDKVLS